MSPEWTSTNGPGKQQHGREGTEEEREEHQRADGDMISSKRREAWHKIVKSGSICGGYPTAVQWRDRLREEDKEKEEEDEEFDTIFCIQCSISQ